VPFLTALTSPMTLAVLYNRLRMFMLRLPMLRLTMKHDMGS
jgi:hypothetical protein